MNLLVAVANDAALLEDVGRLANLWRCDQIVKGACACVVTYGDCPDHGRLGSAAKFAVTRVPAHIVETAADVVRLAVLLSADDGDVGRDVLAVDEDPGGRTAGPTLIVIAGALLSLVNPVLKGPHIRLFLYAAQEASARAAKMG